MPPWVWITEVYTHLGALPSLGVKGVYNGVYLSPWCVKGVHNGENLPLPGCVKGVHNGENSLLSGCVKGVYNGEHSLLWVCERSAQRWSIPLPGMRDVCTTVGIPLPGMGEGAQR